MAELVTLQFGREANWVGAHLWNLNDDPAARSSVLFTARQRPTPRLVAFDLLSSMGALHSASADPAADNAGVPENVVRIERSAKEVDGSSPSLWTDFLTAPLHSDSVVRLGSLDWNDMNSNEFNNFTFGKKLMAMQNKSDSLTDSLRRQVEDCDELQGFPVLLDFSQPAFCGFASDYLAYLQDEFPKTPIVLSAIGVESHLPQLSQQQLERRVLNECLALQALHSADLLLPLYAAPSASLFELPHYKPTSRFHSSGLLALSLETAFSPLWLSRNSPRPLSAILAHLSAPSPKRHLASLSFALPYSPQRKPSLLCPLLSGPYRTDAALCVTRGVNSVLPNTGALTVVQSPLPKLGSLECLFCAQAPPAAAEESKRIPIASALAYLEMTKGFYAHLQPRAVEFARLDKRRAVQCLQEELSVDEVTEAQAAFVSIVEEYATD